MKPKNSHWVALSTVFLLCFQVLLGQPGALDLTFIPLSSTSGFKYKVNGIVNSVVSLPDGKILVGGNFTQYGGVACTRIIRLNPDGTRDSGFMIGSGPNNQVSKIIPLGNGKIIILGLFTSVAGSTRNYIARLNSNGSVDSGFNVAASLNAVPSDVIEMADGKLIIGGSSTAPASYLFRVGTNGAKDNTFTLSSPSPIQSLVRLTNGNILASGSFLTFGGQSRKYLASFNPAGAGTVDPLFDPGTSFSNGAASSFAVRSDGTIMIAGNFTQYQGQIRKYIARISQTTGSLDPTFNCSPGPNTDIASVRITSDNKILIGGRFSQVNNVSKYYVAKLEDNGSLSTFTADLSVTNWTTVDDMNVQADGNLLIAAHLSDLSEYFICRLNSNGAADRLGVGPTGPGAVRKILVLPDGRILIGGSFGKYNSTTRYNLAVVMPDGQLDFTFNASVGGSISSAALQPDGKILICGSFFQVNGTNARGIARLMPNGTLDPTFTGLLDQVGPTTNGIYSLQLQPDGKIIIGGFFSVYDNTTRLNVARLNSNGTVDNTFVPPPTFLPNNGFVYSMARQNDGKILIGGNISELGGMPRNGVARLEVNGTLDQSYNPQFSGSEGYHIGLQSTGKLIVALGSYLHRLNADGTKDNTFQGAVVSPNTLTIQSNDKILVGQWSNGLARFHSNGAPDNSFPLVPDKGIRSVVPTTDNKLYIGGDFASFGGIERNGICRILDCSMVVTVSPSSTTFCNGNYVTLTAQGAATYSWSPATGLSATTGASVVANPSVSTTYTVIGTDSYGCTSSATATITVNPIPSFTYEVDQVCAGTTSTSIQYWAPLANPSLYQLIWDHPAMQDVTAWTALPSGPIPVPVVPTTAAFYDGFLYLKNAMGCESGPLPVTVTVNPNPVASVSGFLVICGGAPTTLTASAGTSYLWSTGATSQSINVTTQGPFSATVTNSYGCSTTSSPVSLTLGSGTGVIHQTTGSTPCPIYLTTGPGYGFLWYNGYQSNYVEVYSPGTYWVTYTNEDGCEVTAYTEVTQDCGGGGGGPQSRKAIVMADPEPGTDPLPPVDQDYTLGVYPNPAGSEVRVVLSSPAESDCPVYFFDILGRPSKQEMISKGTKSKIITVRDLQAGVYVVSIMDNGVVRQKKLIIQQE